MRIHKSTTDYSTLSVWMIEIQIKKDGFLLNTYRSMEWIAYLNLRRYYKQTKRSLLVLRANVLFIFLLVGFQWRRRIRKIR